jgi:hypothetical protein
MERLLIGSAFIFFVSSAHAIECSAQVPAQQTVHWTYRMVEGRKCWYEGHKLVPKASLRWPASKLARPQDDREPMAAAPSTLKFQSDPSCCSRRSGESESFESRWQGIFGTAAGSL